MASTPADTDTLYSPPRSTGEVDVPEAKNIFNDLSRELSRKSSLTAEAGKDIEKGKNEHDVFDLREYLSSSNDANQKAGIKHKHVGVTWEDLQVDVMGGTDFKFYIGTFAGAVSSFFLFPIVFLWGFIAKFLPATEITTRTILHKSSGIVKPGEMCLVLGCPGSGCTTFLKAIANQREEYAAVSGDVRYAGIDAQEMAKYYKGEVVYNQEDDIHIATLTVAQTLAFALSTKTPGPSGRLPGVSRKQFDAQVQKTLLRMFNISHTSDTLVGDEFVRGVSGGERKRVSIVEMMATRANVTLWDNSTRGLDASTALDFIKSLRIITDVFGNTTFVTLYQAGESIYELFDKVLVLDEGRQVYFGPPNHARTYFETLGYKSLPRQSTADYLTGCTDPNERQFAPLRSADDTPSSPLGLENAFLTSPIAHDMLDELEGYKGYVERDKRDQEAFRAAVVEDKKRGVSKRSPYTLGFVGQVKALTKRQFQTRIQDRFQLCTSFGLSTILAFVLGGAYFNLPLSSAGAFTRGGVLFQAMLVICLDAFGEMPLQMLGRPVLRKQTSYSLYRPSAQVVANTFADLPFSATRVLVFDVIVYFMSHLSWSPGAFFTFHLLNYMAFLTMQGIFRTYGLLCVNFFSAFRLATFFIPNMIQYVGYIIPVFSMKRWLFWIYYINPLSYAWAAMMENEFMRISMPCDGAAIIPRNPPGLTKYPDGFGPNQACTLSGSAPGVSRTPGRAYIQAGYELSVSDIWRRNFVVLLAFMLFFQLMQVLLIEYFPQYTAGTSVAMYAKETDETKKRNAALQARKAEQNEKLRSGNEEGEGKSENGVPVVVAAHRKTLTWEGVNYQVPVAGGTRRLLHDVYGYVKPGTLTALMGASGAGKTTCLDVLAQRKNIGVISGDVLVDGRPLDSAFARGTAYAEQMDVHEGTATVREAMRFSAYLRQPSEVSKDEKDNYVEEMIELLELQDLADALVFSLGAEARKRLTIGVELASKPELLLFLDEPTSGLDSQSAYNLVRFLRKLADNGQAILCTIHQPSSLLFESFDRLLLLETGGETVYFGPIGQDSCVVRDYFGRHGAKCPSNVNPAEFMLEAIGAGVSPRIGDRDWNDVWLDSREYRRVLEEIADIKREALLLPEPDQKEQSTYATPFWYQLKTVVKRNSLAIWRNPDYVFSRLYVHVFISLFISLSFLQLGHSSRDLQYRVFGMFWTQILPAIIMSQVQPMFIFNRRTFIRESSSRIYSPYVFAIGQLLGEIPYSVFCGIIYWVLMVYPMGFGQGAAGTNGTGFQLLLIIFLELFGVTLGQLLAATSPSIQVSVLFNPFIIVTLVTFCGVTIPYPTMNTFWRSWLYELNPMTRTMSSMIATELHGLVIKCQSAEFAVFNPPSGQTCMNWANEFVSAFGGYLDNPNDTLSCRYCPYSVGDEFFLPLNIRYENRVRDAFILFAFFFFNIIVTIIASRFLRFAKR